MRVARPVRGRLVGVMSFVDCRCAPRPVRPISLERRKLGHGRRAQQSEGRNPDVLSHGCVPQHGKGGDREPPKASLSVEGALGPFWSKWCVSFEDTNPPRGVRTKALRGNSGASPVRFVQRVPTWGASRRASAGTEPLTRLGDGPRKAHGEKLNHERGGSPCR